MSRCSIYFIEHCLYLDSDSFVHHRPIFNYILQRLRFATTTLMHDVLHTYSQVTKSILYVLVAGNVNKHDGKPRFSHLIAAKCEV